MRMPTPTIKLEDSKKINNVENVLLTSHKTFPLVQARGKEYVTEWS